MDQDIPTPESNSTEQCRTQTQFNVIDYIIFHTYIFQYKVHMGIHYYYPSSFWLWPLVQNRLGPSERKLQERLGRNVHSEAVGARIDHRISLIVNAGD
jgi:hypothetical protein